MISVVLVDDHALVRAGMRALIEDLADVRVVGEAADGESAVSMAAEYRPDVLLLDVSMPGESGLTVLARVMRASPATRVLILSMHAELAYVSEAKRRGASGYVLKDASLDELADALRASNKADFYLSRSLSEGMRMPSTEAMNTKSLELVSRLSQQQREVLQRIAQGHSDAQIAEDLDLSIQSLESLRAELMARLDLHGRQSLVRLAVACGLVQVPS